MFDGLGNNNRRIFAGLSNGKVVIRGKDQEPMLYDHIEGYIKEISKSDRTVKDKPTKFIEIVLADGKGEEAVLSLYEDSTSTRSVLLSLASLKDFSQKVRINAYPRTGGGNGVIFTNVTLYAGGEKLPWVCESKDIPKVETETYKGQEFKDPSKRNAFFDKLYNGILASLDASKGAQRPPVDYDEEPNPDEDMPI